MSAERRYVSRDADFSREQRWSLLKGRAGARHCRRRTRGEAQATKNITELLLALIFSATDIISVPLLKFKEMADIGQEQKSRIGCIQGPTGVELYTIIVLVSFSIYILSKAFRSGVSVPSNGN